MPTPNFIGTERKDPGTFPAGEAGLSASFSDDYPQGLITRIQG